MGTGVAQLLREQRLPMNLKASLQPTPIRTSSDNGKYNFGSGGAYFSTWEFVTRRNSAFVGRRPTDELILRKITDTRLTARMS